jgi:hypothetical protein
MANIYYGDGGASSQPNGDWNDPSNWFLSLGLICGCGGFGGTPAGRVPSIALGDTVFLTSRFNGPEPVVTSITTGPTGGWSGSLNGVGAYETQVDLSAVSASLFTGTINAELGNWTLATGTYNQAIIGPISGGSFSGYLALPAGGTYNGTLTNSFMITGGTFTGNNTFYNNSFDTNVSGSPTFSGTTTLGGGMIIAGTPTFSNNVAFSAGTTTINAGTFGTGAPINATIISAGATVIINGGTYNKVTFVRSAAGTFRVTGGTWTPTATVTVNSSTGLLVPTNLPKDPGFALAGTYTPTIAVSNIPGVLGAGLP